MTQGHSHPDWREDVIDADQPIIDAHHHLYERPQNPYLVSDYAADLKTGHNVIASVFVQARGFYRSTGPAVLYPVGETEYAAGAASHRSGICAGIVGYADLTLGDDLRPLLQAHIQAGQGRFRGIRHILAWNKDASLLNPAYPTTPDLMDSPAFNAGFAQLGDLELSFDAWVHFAQIPRLAALARRFSNVPIVLNHCGGVLGTYAGQRDADFDQWKAAIADLATCDNVMVKVGGLGMALSGFGFDRATASSNELAAAWRPYVAACIAAFGPNRVMFESNFPADKVATSYETLWNAFKRLTKDANPDDRNRMFCTTAARFYRLNVTELAQALRKGH